LGGSSWNPPDASEVIKSKRRQQNNDAKWNLDEHIRQYTDLKTKNPGDYKSHSLMNKAREELVLMLQEMSAQLWEPLEHPKRQMEVVANLKKILLDNRSASSPYAVLLMELVVGPNLAELRSWIIDNPQQDELVLFLLRLPLQLSPMRSFLEDLVKPELSKSAERFDAMWEAELGRVWLRSWMSIIGRQFLEPLVQMLLKSLEYLMTKSTSESTYKNYDMVVP
jgi:hypothetical protein